MQFLILQRHLSQSQNTPNGAMKDSSMAIHLEEVRTVVMATPDVPYTLCGKDWTNVSMLSAPQLLLPEKTVNFGLSVAMTGNSVNFGRLVPSTDVQRNQSCTASFEYCYGSNAVEWACMMSFYWNIHFILSWFLYVPTKFLLQHHLNPVLFFFNFILLHVAATMDT